MEIRLDTSFCGVKLPNPFVVSQLPPTGDEDVLSRMLEVGWGGVLLKTTRLDSDDIKNKKERVPLYRGVDYEEKRLVELGWIEPQNPVSLDKTEKLIGKLKDKNPNGVVIGSMVGSSREEWLKVSRRLSQAGADLIECDFSRGSADLTGGKEGIVADSKQMEKATRYVREGARHTPVIIKLPGRLDNLKEAAAIVKENGADAITLYYEPKGVPGINLANYVPFPNVGTKSSLCLMGGASVKPFMLAVLAEWSQAKPGLPISSLGGAYSWRDAVELMLMGAGMVQFHGAVLERGIGLIEDLKSGVRDYLEEKMVSSIDKLVGKSVQYIVEPDKLPASTGAVASIEHDLCTRCGVCFRVCESLGYNAITMNSQRKPAIDKKKCVGDGLCVAACPVLNCMSLRKKASK